MNSRTFLSTFVLGALGVAAGCGSNVSSSGTGGSGGSTTTTTTSASTGGTMMPGPCNDGVKSASESDVDCGGACPRCADGKACKGPDDCVSTACIGNVCVEPSCTDQVKDGEETDLDCGGTCSTACADGKSCKIAGDCQSGVCTAFVCQAGSCKDGSKNGNETGVDCGGSCPRCGDGQPCASQNDCQSTLCEGMVCKTNLVWGTAFGDAAAQAITGVAVDANGNTLIVGTFAGTVTLGGAVLASAGGTDIVLAKLDPGGTVIWAKRFGDAADQTGTAIAVDGAGTVYITGSVKGTVDFGLGPHANAADPLGDVYLASFSAVGTATFSKRFATSFDQAGLAIAVNPAHEVLLGGTFASGADLGCGALPGAGGSDVFVAKLSPAGACLWSKRYGDVADQTIRSLAYDGMDNVLAGGSFAGAISFGGFMFTMNGAAHGGWAAKLDPNGAHVWSSALGNALADQEVTAITADPSGNIILAGAFAGTFDLGLGPTTSLGQGDLFVAKLDSSGNALWGKAFGDGADQVGRAFVATDSQGKVLLSGDFQGTIDLGLGTLSSAGQSDLFVAKLDADGIALWTKRYGDAKAQTAAALARLDDGTAVIGGSFQGSLDLGAQPFVSQGATDAFVAVLATP